MNALPADISFVTTPQELFEAVRDGAQDIVITSHLDLTGLPLRNSTQCTGCQAMLGDVHPWTRSIRVRLIPECHSRVSSLHINSHLAQANIPTSIAQSTASVIYLYIIYLESCS